MNGAIVSADVIRPLVHANRNEMLSYVLFECKRVEWMTTHLLRDVVSEARSRTSVELINTKIDMMNGVVPVKKEDCGHN